MERRKTKFKFWEFWLRFRISNIIIIKSYDDEDAIKEIEIRKKNNLKNKGRKGVSAEAYGKFNNKTKFDPKVIKKTPDQISRIKNRIINSFLIKKSSIRAFKF
jgi:hypothetical protein